MENINELLDLYYNEDNYEIMNFSPTSNICYVFFSSLGLYRFNDIDGLKFVHDNNRYEWKSLMSNNIFYNRCGKMIFVRDIKKIFYLEGINAKLNNINKLASFLEQNTKGMDVYLVGSSAGGYAAFTISNYLHNVKRIYSLGGVVNLNEHSTYLDYSQTHKNKSATEIVDSINRDAFVVHFYGSFNQESLRGIDIIRNLVYGNKCATIPLKSKEHAPRPSGNDLIKLLICKDRHLNRIRKRTKNKKEIGQYHFSIINLGFARATLNRTKRIIKALFNHEKKI